MHFNALLKYFWNCRSGGGLGFVFAVSLQHIHHAVFIISCKIGCNDCWVMCEVTPESFFIGFFEASCIHSFLLTLIRNVELVGVREQIYCLHCYSASTLSCSSHGQIIYNNCIHTMMGRACILLGQCWVWISRSQTHTHVFNAASWRFCRSDAVSMLLLMPRSWVWFLANNTLTDKMYTLNAL